MFGPADIKRLLNWGVKEQSNWLQFQGHRGDCCLEIACL